MRVCDIAVGDSYAAFIPQRFKGFSGNVLEDWSLRIARGHWFPVAVTSVVDTGKGPAMVEVLRFTSNSRAEVTLTDDQASELGLPSGDYSIDGVLRDAAGQLVHIPELDPLRLPARWLKDLDEVRSQPRTYGFAFDRW